MVTPEAKKNLLLLTKDSSSLSASTKEDIFKQIETLNELQVRSLIETLEDEKKRLAKIDEDFRQKEIPIKKAYLEAIENFQHTGMSDALKGWEKSEEKGKEEQLENLLKQMSPDKKKKHHYFLFLLFAAIVAGAIYYLLVYAKH